MKREMELVNLNTFPAPKPIYLVCFLPKHVPSKLSDRKIKMEMTFARLLCQFRANYTYEH